MLQLFYFSGTGNARNVAHWIGAAWKSREREAVVRDLTKMDVRTVEIGADDEVGFASPTHGFNLPPVTLDFLFAFPRAPKRNRAFVVNTRAGLKLFGVFVPGLSGVAQMLAALVLTLKGYRIVGLRPIDLPSNWISIHPGLREDNVRALYARCELVTQRFANRLMDGRRDFRALWDLPQDLLIAPISLGYYLIGRFWFAKSFIASGACDACGVCVKGCPVKALHMVGDRPFWSYRCESCMRCMNQCPKRAIETAHGFAVGVPVLLSVALSALVYPALSKVVPSSWLTGIVPAIVRNIAEPVLMLLVLFASYRLLHVALRWRVVERLVVWTSLTHLHFWRRYRAPRK